MATMAGKFELHLGYGQITLDQICPLSGGLSVGPSCVLWEHPAGSSVSDDQRPEGWEAVRSVQSLVVIGRTREGRPVTLYSVGGCQDSREQTPQH